MSFETMTRRGRSGQGARADEERTRWQARSPAAIAVTIGVVCGAIWLGGTTPAWATDGPPPIRTQANNRVPACVTPDRLMAYVASRNPALEPKFSDIATHYREHGQRWGVRWDYAFFQMLLETNYLKFRRANGQRGDVHPRQNNFAGLGATGGGVPGDSYRDVSTGVRAQIEHLVAYSGERVPNPVGARTRLKQDDIIAVSRKLTRAVTFADLRNRWAADRNYARSIEMVATRFREDHCNGSQRPAPRETAALPTRARDAARTGRADTTAASSFSRPLPPQPMPAGRGVAFAATAAPIAGALAREARGAMPPPAAVDAGSCRIMAASYGGEKTVLIRSNAGGETHYTLLTVLDGFERSLTASYVDQHAPGGTPIGTYATRTAALARAQSLCR